MKKTIKRALSVLLCAALLLGAAPLLAFAADPTSGSCGSGVTWSYNTSSKTLTIRGSGAMNNYSTEVYGNYSVPVTTAPWRPYYMTMKNVVIESGVTQIGNNAFYFCLGMESVTIPGSVSYFGNAAFGGCSGLNAVRISSVAAWCEGYFYNNLSNPLYYAHNLYVNGSPASELVIPSGVTRVREYAFANCTNITDISFPNGFLTVAAYAFENCTGLTELNFPAGTSTISYGAFRSCTALTSLSMPNTVATIGSDAFAYCVRLTSANVSDRITDINGGLFRGCVSLENVTIGSGVTYVSSNAFLVGFDADTIAGIQSAYDSAVENGSDIAYTPVAELSLDAIRVILAHPNGSLTDVFYRGTEANWNKIYFTDGNDALKNATIHFPDRFMGLSYLNAGDNTVSVLDCDDWITEIAIPGGIEGSTVVAIENEAFKGNNLMTSLTIPKTVTSIGEKIFQITAPDYYHTALVSSINSMMATYSSYGLDVKDYFRDEMERNGPIWSGTVRYDEVIYYVDHGEWPTTSLTDVYFDGTEEEWNQIAIDPDNAILLGATLHFLNVEHSHSYVSSYTAPTCTADGARTYTCTCGDMITQTLKALGHDYASEVTQEATCSAAGVRTYTCSRCGDSYTESIPMLAHDFETVVTKEATCIEEGSCIKTCKRCQYSCTETLPMTKHVDANDDGLCDFCGAEDVDNSDIHVGETKIVTVASGEIAKLCFVPKVTGTYTLASGANADTYGHLYDANMNQIASNDDYGTQIGTDFALTYDLIKGQTYYFGCRYFYSSQSGSYPVTLTLDSALETLDAAAGTDTVIDTMNGVIYGLDPQVTDPSDYFVTKSDYTSAVTPSGQNGETDIYSTGSLVKVYSGSTLVASYKLVLFGDVNGDGWYDGTDAYFVSLLVNGMIPQTALTAAQRKACDANHDGAIDAADVTLLEQAGLLLNEVDQTGTQQGLANNGIYLDYCSLIDQSVETIELEQPAEPEAPKPTAQSVMAWLKALYRLVLNWLFSVFQPVNG